MRTAFAVVALLGLTTAQTYNNRAFLNPYQRKQQHQNTTPDEDLRPEECKTKIDSLVADIDVVETTCDE